MIITTPTLSYTIAAILLIFASVAAFTYYPFPATAYSQIEPSSTSLYKNIVSTNSSSSEQQMRHQSQSKVIEASGHFANNQIENDSVSWIQGGLWHLAVYNSSSSTSSPNSANVAKAIFSGNFTMVKTGITM
jgi:hypothetical protein